MRRVIIIFLLVIAALPLCAQNIYLLSVGISDYEGYDNDLRLPVNDAATISKIYEKNSKGKVVTIFNSNATCSAIKEKMSLLFSGAQKDDIIIFFFSGHGSTDGFCAYDGLLTYSEIRNIFSQSKCVNKMVFADACFSGELRANNRHTTNSRVKNVMFFLSSRSDETSWESSSMNNGYFTAFLERGLRGGADRNRNRIVTAKELFNFVSKGVKEMTGNKQHPVMWGNFSNDMPVIRW